VHGGKLAKAQNKNKLTKAATRFHAHSRPNVLPRCHRRRHDRVALKRRRPMKLIDRWTVGLRSIRSVLFYTHGYAG